MYVKHYKKKFKVKNTTMSNDLNNAAKQVFGPQFKGVYAQDTVPKNLLPNSMFIFNTDLSNKPGIHWCAGYKAGKNVYIYDSYGRKSSKLLPVLKKQHTGGGFKIIDSDTLDKEQTVNQRNCGIRCLAWLSIVRDFGIKEALKI